MKYTMIIADDEEIERKALRLLLQKEFPEIDLVAMAANGTELVSLVQRYKPDMAIVDINMPGINGIDGIDLLCAKGSKTHFIINTAYDEFEYVQRALSLKIDAYILKPERRDTTVGTIRKLCRQIDEARASTHSQQQIQELFTQILPVMESEIMYSLFIGEPAEKSFSYYCEMHAAEFYAGTVVAMIPVAGNQCGLRDQDKAALRAELNAAFHNSCTFLATVTDSNICLLLFTPKGTMGEQRRWVSDVLRVAFDKLNRRLPMRAGVGGIYSEFGKMAASYQESLMALMGPSEGGITFYKPKTQKESLEQNIEHLAEELCTSVTDGNLKRMGRQLSGLQTLFQREPASARKLWELVGRQLCLELEIGELLQPQLEKTKAALTGENPGIDVSAVLLEGLSNLVMLLEAREEGTGAYVRQALRYIEENFASDISLDSVAEQIGISPYYLSRLFKAEKGESFVEYLTQVRMNAATRLAKETRLPIRDIAQRTGYSNPTYFCRVFKKNTGKTIGDLREQNRRKNF